MIQTLADTIKDTEVNTNFKVGRHLVIQLYYGGLIFLFNKMIFVMIGGVEYG